MSEILETEDTRRKFIYHAIRLVFIYLFTRKFKCNSHSRFLSQERRINDFLYSIFSKRNNYINFFTVILVSSEDSIMMVF